MRDGWDELVGHLGLLVSMLGLWRTMGFASFAHYCAERLRVLAVARACAGRGSELAIATGSPEME